MTKFILVLTLLTVFSSAGLLYADHIPVPPEGVVEFEGRIAAFLKINDFQPLAELKARLEEEEREFRYLSFTLGSYYRLHENLKVGAFYRVQRGERHDDDWVFTDPGWKWEDTRDRFEHLLMADVSPRFLLDFIPGKNWVLMLKNRYIFNTFNSEHTILVRPGLTYFLLYDREPLFNFSFNYYLYFPLNFGETTLYKHFPQVSVLYHASPLLKLELTGSYRTTFWSTSEEELEIDGEKYSEAYQRWVVGFGVLFNIEP